MLVMSKQQQAPGELELVRLFVNTADLLDDEEHLPDPPALAAWLCERGIAGRGLRATPADLRRAVEMREALREVLIAHTAQEAVPSAALQTLNSIAERARLRLRFDEPDCATLEPQRPGVDGALGRLLAIVHDSIADSTWPRLKACRLEDCEWAFYDRTKNRCGAWCNMDVCGNRAKARAYRRRRRQS